MINPLNLELTFFPWKHVIINWKHIIMDSNVTNNYREEMAIDEAELEPSEFAEKMVSQQKLQEQVDYISVLSSKIHN